jgi:hypothetical protein
LPRGRSSVIATRIKPSWKTITVVGILVAEVAVLSLIAWSASTGPADGIAVRASEAAIRMADQTAVTSSLTVEWLVVPGPSWVIVQTDYDGGEQGAIIGKKHVEAGESINVEIGIETTMLPHAAVVTLVSDRGEVGAFEYTGEMSSGGMGASASSSASADKPYVVKGGLVSAPFSIRPLSFDVAPGTASMGAAVRSSDGSTVTVADILAPGRSWLAVSMVTTSGAPGEVLGAVQIPPGRTGSIAVPLQTDVGKETTLTAALHADLGTPGEFEYSISDVGNSPDQPYVAGGQTVKMTVPPAR